MSLVEAPILDGSFLITVKHYRNYIFLILEDVKQKFLPNYFYKAFNCLIMSRPIAFTKI